MIIERRLFQTPEISTMTTCTSTNSTMPLAQMKWMVRADLPAAEEVEQPREGGVHAGRHGEAGRAASAAAAEDDGEVGELLQHVVALGLLALGEVGGATCSQIERPICRELARRVGTRSRRRWPLDRLETR